MSECATCDGRTEIYTGRDERETGMPITVDCPNCDYSEEPSFDHVRGDDDPWADRPGYGAAEAADPVNSPPHYKWLPNGTEVIDITENFDFLVGNVLKYILRAEHKGKPLEDMKKARWYLDRAIANRESRA